MTAPIDAREVDIFRLTGAFRDAMFLVRDLPPGDKQAATAFAVSAGNTQLAIVDAFNALRERAEKAEAEVARLRAIVNVACEASNAYEITTREVAPHVSKLMTRLANTVEQYQRDEYVAKRQRAAIDAAMQESK